MNNRITLTPFQLVGLTAVLLFAFGASLGMAFNLDAIAVSFDTTNTVAGFVASAEMAAIASATLVFARLAGRVDPHRVYTVGVGVIVIFNIASIAAPDPVALALLRLPAGFALGAVSATVMGTAGRSDTPEMTFAAITAMMGAMGIFIAFVLPRALRLHQVLPPFHDWSQLDGLYVVYVLFSACALLFIRWTPGKAGNVAVGARAKSAAGIFGWMALLGLGLMFFGHGLLGLFLVKIGRGLGLAPETVGYAFMGTSLLGVGVPIAAGYLGSRFSSRGPLVVIAIVIVVAGMTVANASTPMTFFLAMPIFAALPAAIFPIFLGALARLDPTGGLTAANQAFVMVGGAMAPFIGGSLSDFGGYHANGIGVACFFGLGLILALPGLSQADGLRRPLAVRTPAPLGVD